MAGDGLRLVPGGAPGAAPGGPAADPVTFRDGCLLAFEASQVARGFSRNSMDNGAAVLERFLAACGRPAWDVTREDVDRVVAGLTAQGLAASTRRGYVQAFKGFHAFLVARKASEIEAAFGVRLVNPVDEFNAARHVGSDSPSVNPPPDPERMEEFFGRPAPPALSPPPAAAAPGPSGPSARAGGVPCRAAQMASRTRASRPACRPPG